MLCPKVSVVIPVYNVEKYLHQCMDSVLNQTLKEIEVIAVDDGSTDSSGAILDEYAAADSRVKVIHKKNGGYGIGMNTGFAAATGEYIGIVESDDYAEPEMFEALYSCAHRFDLDAVKSGFYFYWTKPEVRNEKVIIASQVMCSKTFCPSTDFKAPMEMVDFFNIKPTIWSAIYKKSFIEENNIRFNETPGASFQDAAFNFKVWTCAKKVRLMQECFLHYRQDNEASSINSPGKVYCVADEYREMDRFLQEEKPILRDKVEGVRLALKYNSYIWNYNRLSENLQKEFIEFASEEFKEDITHGYLEKKYFPFNKWQTLFLIMEQPLEFHNLKLAERRGETYKIPGYNADFTLPQKIKRKVVKAFDCLRQYGFVYTFMKTMRVIQRRILRK